ncbi:MAG: hypothetical protein ACOYEP_10715 [Limnochordia bacterium]
MKALFSVGTLAFRTSAIFRSDDSSVKTMCRVLQVSTSGYHAWRTRPPSAHALRDEALLEKILAIHEAGRQAHGAS